MRSKAFLVSLFLMPIFMGGAITMQAVMGDQVDMHDRRVAVVDASGELLPGLERAAAQRNESEVMKDGAQVRPRFLFEAAESDEARLSARVKQGELFAYLLIDAGVLTREAQAALSYHTKNPTFEDLPRWIGNTINAELRRIRFERAGLDRKLVDELSTPVELKQYGVAKVSATGEVKKEKVDELRMFLMPFASLMLLFALVMMAAPALLNTVLEEKIQRISEILVSSVSPFELFLGKLLGNVFISWTIFLIYMGGGIAVAAHYDALSWIPLG